MKIAGICDKDTAVGLRLAGIQEFFIPDKDNPRKTWQEFSERDDLGVVFITEKIAEEMSKDLKEFRIKNILPIIVEIPDKKGHMKEHMDYISHLIKKAVGVEVKKER
jgi:V/A-type H+-transporting ATPase subunit F